MTTTHDTPQSVLLEELAKLETQLATPAISGEEAAWLTATSEALRVVEREVRVAVGKTHPAQFGQMRKEDAALGSQIESLEQEDQANLQRLDEIVTRIAKLHGKYTTEANESLLKEDFDNFVDEGLAFVVAVRKQETALTTWFAEAFRRDVGAAD